MLPLLLLVQMASQDTLLVYHGRDNRLEVRIPRYEADVVIDGSLDELAWSRAGLLTGFSQFSPNDGRPAADSTEVLVWYSPSALHFGVRAFEAHGAVHATLADRDRIFSDDHIQILLSTFNDGRQATVFMVNPFGVQADGALVETGQAGSTGIFGGGGGVARDPTDLNPDFVFQSKGRLTEYGYEVEVRIPFKSVRYQAVKEQTWGINVVRRVQHSGYEDSWAPAKRDNASFLSQSGRLVGLNNLKRGLVLDLQPELTARVDGAPNLNGDWNYDRKDPELGGNVRWGITNNLTMNGTANPDFAQIESDAGQVTFDPRQSLFFSEKRPFFLDGSEQFNSPNSLIYTRRVVQPVAAVKLTGNAFGTNVGLLSAVDDREVSFSAEDHPIYNILRVQRDVGARSRIGLVYTDKVDGDNFNRVLGFDGRFVFRNIYQAQFQLAGSRTRTLGTTTEGPLWFARFTRNGRKFGFRYSINAIGDQFQSQSGFIGRRNVVNATVVHSLIWTRNPGSFVERVTQDVQLHGTWKYQDFIHGQETLDNKLHFNTAVTLRGGWDASAAILIETFGYDDDIYEGYALDSAGTSIPWSGPRTRDIPNFDVVASFNTPEFAHFSANAFSLYGHDENFFEWASGELFILNGGMSYRPTDQLRLELSYQHQQVNRVTDGSLVDIQRIPRLKMEYQISRPFFVRLIGEYADRWTDALRDASRTGFPILINGSPSTVEESRRLRGDVLLSYKPNPGTVFFAGYGSTRERLPDPDPANLNQFLFRRTTDAFFLKASYLFRM